MILYVDETENDEYFIVAGLLVESDAEVNLAYKRFKKRIKSFNIREKFRSRLFTEFKSTLLDNTYPRVKERMIGEILSLEGMIIYSCFVKKDVHFNQELKESVYITLLSKILGEIKSNTVVLFDSFGKKDFEDRIIRSFIDNDIIDDLFPGKSEKEAGLQFIDNICSVIRLHKSGDGKDRFFDLIKGMIKEV